MHPSSPVHLSAAGAADDLDAAATQQHNSAAQPHHSVTGPAFRVAKEVGDQLPVLPEEEEEGRLPEADLKFQPGHRAFRRSASSQGPRIARKGSSFSHDAQSAKFHPHGWSRRSTHGKTCLSVGWDAY